MTSMLRLAACLALTLAAACGGVAVERESPEYSGDDSAESPAAAPDAPAPSPMDGADGADDTAVEPEVEVAPSTPAPSDEPEAEAAPASPTFPLDGIDLSPATRDDEPAPAPESPAPADDQAEPEPVPGWIQGGDVCTADEQCVEGLVCAEVSPYLPDGSGWYENAGERRCGYVAP